MAYKQEPGRGPMATFKNVSSLLGPTANGIDPKTGVKIVAGRKGDASKKPPTWTDDYDSVTYATPSGKGVTKYSPKSYVVGGKPKYYETSQKNPQAKMTEIKQSQFVNLLSKGDKATGEGYKKVTEKDVITGGKSLASLGLD